MPLRQAVRTESVVDMMRGAATWISLLEPNRVGRQRLKAGETLFRQDDPATAIYLVVAGRVRLVRHLEDDSSVVLHVARSSETFADAALFADHYHCDAVADATSEVSVIPKAGLLTVLETDPQACLGFARELASHVRDLRARLELRNIRTAPDRIVAWLRLQAAGDPPTARLDRPWTQIAAELGLTHEAIYRALAALEREGRIMRHREAVVLTHTNTK